MITLRAKLNGAVYCNRSCLVLGSAALLQPARSVCVSLSAFFIAFAAVSRSKVVKYELTAYITAAAATAATTTAVLQSLPRTTGWTGARNALNSLSHTTAAPISRQPGTLWLRSGRVVQSAIRHSNLLCTIYYYYYYYLLSKTGLTLICFCNRTTF